MIKHIELPRMTDGLLAPPGGSAKKSGKRLREGGAVSSPNFSPKVEQLVQCPEEGRAMSMLARPPLLRTLHCYPYPYPYPYP